MRLSGMIAAVLMLVMSVACSCSKEEITEEPPIDVPEKPDKPLYDETGCSYTSYVGLVMCGYQGWFNAEGDGAGRGWHHYEKGNEFRPGVSTIDFWPDVSEYEVTYPTAFSFKNGEPAHVYSPYDYETVDLHFKWMQDYGIDGVYMQRFVSEIKHPSGKRHFNKVLENALTAAKKYDRAISVMYDLSGSTPEELDIVYSDWKELQSTFDLFNNAKHPSYLRHNGKPLVAIWGVGFNDNRKYSLDDTKRLMMNIKNASRPSSVMLGVPYYWREMKNDTENSPVLHEMIREADVIMPWAVGRYNNDSYGLATQMIPADIAKCKTMDVDYAPLVFPGFSWGNLKNEPNNYDQIKREKGDFLWHQIANAKLSGAKSLYVAMFDEVDEGTAIFKCLKEGNLPLNGDLRFVGIEEEVKSDHYLWLTGQAARWFKGEGSYGVTQPQR